MQPQPQPQPLLQSAYVPGLPTPLLSAHPTITQIPKRPLDSPFPGREIRPKPMTTQTFPQPPVDDRPQLKRKRGRPSKAQVQARAAAEAAASRSVGAAGPAPRPVTPAPAQAAAQTVMGGSTAAGAGAPAEQRSSLQAPTRMQISAVLTPTNPNTASNSSSSSGKRRRGRSTRSNPEAQAGDAGLIYQSPYGRAAEDLEDTPARAAVLRHREEQLPPPPRVLPRSSSGEAAYGGPGAGQGSPAPRSA